MRIVVVGGHGKVALHFARQAVKQKQTIVSLIRDKSHESDIEDTGAKSLLLSLEDASVDQLAEAFEGAQGVLFAAGAGGKGGEARTKAVDYEGAVKVFDAVEKIEGTKPHLVLVGAIDTRDMSKPPPPSYSQEDVEKSRKAHEKLKTYYEWKLEADRNLVQRTAFPWTILRPGTLTDEKGTGKIKMGHIPNGTVTREDVAGTLLELFKSRELADGLTLDLIDGDNAIADEVKIAVSRGISSYLP